MRIVHLELHTRDLERARDFYAALCGWQTEQFETPNGTYTGLHVAPDIDGGLVECTTGQALWLPYVEVPSVKLATERARRLGASVLLEPREGPTGWRSVIATPAGGEIAFWRQKR